MKTMACPDCGHALVRDTSCDGDDMTVVACAGGHMKVIPVTEWEAATAEAIPTSERAEAPLTETFAPEPADNEAEELRYQDYWMQHGVC